jgi:hypothetical protein
MRLRHAMGCGNRGLWALLCVLIVVVLVLAAMLLPKWGYAGRSGAPVAIATALGGGLALGGGAASRRKKRIVLGGRDEDFDNDNIAKGADGLEFPNIQKNPLADVQGAHHNFRVLLKSAIEQYEKEEGDDTVGSSKIGSGPPSADTVGVPSKGWGHTNSLVISAYEDFKRMCDIIRGDFSFISGYPGTTPVPDYPWGNDSDLGDGNIISRLNRWSTAHGELSVALEQLVSDLVDSKGNDLPSKNMFHQARDSLELSISAGGSKGGPFLRPNTPRSGSAPVADASWSGVTNTTHPLDNNFLHLFISDFTTCISQYTVPTVDLRAGNLFDVDKADDAVKVVINCTNEMLDLTKAGTKVTFARWNKMKEIVGAIDQGLTRWAEQIDLARKHVGPGEHITEYQQLYDNIGDVSSPDMGSLLHIVKLYLFGTSFLEPPPGLAPRFPGSRINSADLHSDYTVAVKDRLVEFSLRLDLLMTNYAHCRDRYELDWDKLDTLVSNIEVSTAAFGQLFKASSSWNGRVQSVQLYLDLATAVSAFKNTLGNDQTFIDRHDSGSTTAVQLWTSTKALNNGLSLYLPGADVPRSSYLTPPVGAPKPPHDIATFMDATMYNTTIINVGNAVREFVRTVFSGQKTAPTWDGIRRQYDALRGRVGSGRSPLVDPDSNVYVNVAIAAEAFARACFEFADKGDPVKIQDAANAKKQFMSDLHALQQEVTNSALLRDNFFPGNIQKKKDFNEAIQRAETALKGVPTLSLPDQGAFASLQVARPLTESQRLIHYKSAPTESVIFASNPDIVVSAAGQKVVLEAKTPEDLEGMVARLPKHGPSLAYGLVVDRPGDMTALYKAVAIRLELRLPPEIERKVADRKNAATGWLYNIVQFESGAYYTSQHDYIKPEFYAV